MTIQEWAEDLAIEHLPALEILIADRCPVEKAAKLIAAAALAGHDTVAFAEHFVKLRKAFRGERS